MAAAPYEPAPRTSQMYDTRVSKPNGLSISVAGSSFIVVRKTSAAPAATPGAMSGSVTSRNAPVEERPSVRAASVSLGSTWSTDDRTEPTACGRNRTTYANTSRGTVLYSDCANSVERYSSASAMTTPGT